MAIVEFLSCVLATAVPIDCLTRPWYKLRHVLRTHSRLIDTNNRTTKRQAEADFDDPTQRKRQRKDRTQQPLVRREVVVEHSTAAPVPPVNHPTPPTRYNGLKTSEPRKLDVLERPFPCRNAGCEKRFKRRPDLTRHEIIHTGKKDHRCLCGKRFNRNDNLIQHRRICKQSLNRRSETEKERHLKSEPFSDNDGIPPQTAKTYVRASALSRTRRLRSLTHESTKLSPFQKRPRSDSLDDATVKATPKRKVLPDGEQQDDSPVDGLAVLGSRRREVIFSYLDKCGCETDCGEACLNRVLTEDCYEGNCRKDHCSNRKVSEHIHAHKHGKCHIRTFKTRNGRGRGALAKGNLAAAQLVCVYYGKYFNGKKIGFYLLKIDGECIDGAVRGSLARFVNHSCEPNCVFEPWHVNGEPNAILRTMREVREGEELTVDYRASGLTVDELFECRCGSAKCRRVIGPGYAVNESTYVTIEGDHVLYWAYGYKLLNKVSGRSIADIGNLLVSRMVEDPNG